MPATRYASYLILLLVLLSALARTALPKDDQSPVNQDAEDGTDTPDIRVRRQHVDRELGSSPEDVDTQLLRSDSYIDSLFGPFELPFRKLWDDVTGDIDEAIGLKLGMAYTSLFQWGLSSEKSEFAAGGDFDFFGTWDVMDSEDIFPGQFTFEVETRHAYGDLAPQQLGREFGLLWPTTVGHSTHRLSLTQLYGQVGSIENHFQLRLGWMDPALVYDSGRYVSDNYGFLSPAFSDTLPMALPGPGAGFALAIYPFWETYIVAGVNDANGSRAGSSISSVFTDREFFYALELGVTPNFGETGEGQYHVTFWRTDSADGGKSPAGHGYALTLEQELGARGIIVPFVRYSRATGGARPVQELFSVGIGFEEVFGQNEDVVAVAFALGRPDNGNLRDQQTFEIFYRLYLTENLHITPDLQVIRRPSGGPGADTVTVLSLRLRLLF